MRISTGCFWLCLPLLASFEASRAGAQPVIHPGKVAIVVSPNQVLGLSSIALEPLRGLCDPPPPPETPPVILSIFIKGTFTLTSSTATTAPVSPPPTPGTASRGVFRADPGTNQPSLAVESLRLALETVESPCGPWTALMTLDPDVLQSTTPLVLEGAPEEPGHGVFAGVLEMHTRLHLENSATGQSVDLALPLAFNLAGPWALATDEDGLDLPDSESNLILGATRVDGALKAQSFYATPTFLMTGEGECALSLEAGRLTPLPEDS
jgi:hypothetical protein